MTPITRSTIELFQEEPALINKHSLRSRLNEAPLPATPSKYGKTPAELTQPIDVQPLVSTDIEMSRLYKWRADMQTQLSNSEYKVKVVMDTICIRTESSS